MSAKTAVSAYPALDRPGAAAPPAVMTYRALIAIGLLAVWPGLQAHAGLPRISQYTRLDKCRLLERNEDEGGWSVQRCPGLGGYRLRLTEGDLRQNVVVELPGGGERSLALAETTGSGGFSSLGAVVEWRGPRAGGFPPRRADLALCRGRGPGAAGKAHVLSFDGLACRPPALRHRQDRSGGRQNDRARTIADASARCLG